MAIVGIAFCGLAGCSETQTQQPGSAAQLLKEPGLQLLGNRFFTFNTVVRVNQIETSRDVAHGEDPDMEIRWFMNKDFRLALLRNWKANTPEKLIDFTRYDLKAQEPADPKPGQHIRNWSLLNRLNQKGIRPQDKPIPIGQLNADEQAIIKHRYPELINGGSK